MGQVLGRVDILVDGEKLQSEEGASIDIGGVEREEKIGNDSVHFTEKYRPATIKCDYRLSAKTTPLLEKLRDATDVTVTFAADTGQRFIIRSAFSKLPPEITAGDGGKIPVEFVGNPAEID